VTRRSTCAVSRCSAYRFGRSHCPQSPEKKKEEFRQYLERSGVIDALTKVLVGLYEEPEKPANAIE